MARDSIGNRLTIVIHRRTHSICTQRKMSKNARIFVAVPWHLYCKNPPSENPRMDQPQVTSPDDLTSRARAEFREMPGMCLTTAQAARLWQLSPARAEELLTDLVQSGFLVRRDGQRYRLPSSV